jgi:tRNA A-37 threonylcarbamoyl transferase component Bud32
VLASTLVTSEHDASEAQKVAHQPTAAAVDGASGMLGRELDGRYRIVRVLGEGGMGAVFVAEHLTLHKQFALKVIRAELAGNGEVAARFAREAMATAQFEHPHVASAIDYGTLPEGGAYFVMQLVRGRSLRSLFGGGGANARVPWRRACELAAQVADALSAAKAAGIIHRDLKPDNILVEQREDGSDLVKVLDFGIAHIAPRDASDDASANRQLTRVGMVMGTPGYMAPEQAVGDKVDHRADLYALGVVLWECIAGRELWDGPDLTTVIARQMGEPVPELRDVTGDVSLPTELDELLQRLTSRLPEGRPEHAAEVRDTLRRLSVSGGAPRPSLPDVVANLPQVMASVTPFVRTAITRFQEQPARTRGAQLVLAAALLATLMVLVLRGDEAGATAETTTDATAGAAGAGTAEAPKEPSLLSKVTATAKQLAAAAAPKPEMPEALRDEAEALVQADSARDRRGAAEAILAYRPEDAVLAHVRTIAELEIARTCKARKQAIAKMRKEADRRYLVPLERLSSMPRSGCGFLDLSDCYSCIRTDLRVAIASIETHDGAGGAAAEPATEAQGARAE